MELKQSLDLLVPKFDKKTNNPIDAIRSGKSNCLGLAGVALVLNDDLIALKHTVTDIFQHYLVIDPRSGVITHSGNTTATPQSRELHYSQYRHPRSNGSVIYNELDLLVGEALEDLMRDPEGFHRFVRETPTQPIYPANLRIKLSKLDSDELLGVTTNGTPRLEVRDEALSLIEAKIGSMV